MKNIIIVSAVFILLTTACDEQLDQAIITDPAAHNMKIIPANPFSSDEIKLIVYDDCSYHTLTGMKIIGKSIEIEKQFNSMMMMPCFMRNDTIIIGKLPEGSYTINYKLLDNAKVPPKISIFLTYKLLISK
ncbi:MAG: hypothetical protein WCL21_04725 [Mariniphaga sp.]